MIGQLDAVHYLRAKPRFKLFEPTEMTVLGTSTRVHMLNLSATGALLYASVPPAPGTLLRVRYGGEKRAARVAWASGRRFGVSFAVPLADRELATVIAAQRALVASASKRIGAVAGA